ncbi:unknown [Prevotella sp. CAG:891]|nr:unknown [Prevotella sp. CAG:891]
MRRPIPPMFIFESFSAVESPGIIMPNILAKMSLWTLGLLCFLMTFSPQKVKKMVTFLPVAAAPLASTKVARALSRSSLNMMKVLPSRGGSAGVAVADCGATAGVPLVTQTQ